MFLTDGIYTPLLRSRILSAIMCVLLLASVAFVGWHVSALLGATAERHHVDRVTVSVLALARDISDLERGQHSFLLTGEEPFLAPYHRALRDIDSRIATLRSLVGADEASTRVVVRIASEQYRLAVFAGRTIALRRQGNAESALTLERQGTGWALTESIDTDIAVLLDGLQARQAAIAAGIDLHRDHVEWGLRAVVAISIVFMLRHFRVLRAFHDSPRRGRTTRNGASSGVNPVAGT
jgi:CHASE3 domain sensor protein